LRLSHSPQAADKIQYVILSHPGVLSAVYTGLTMSLLVHYDPVKIKPEEIILRAALSLSVDYQVRPVVIKSSNATAPISALPIISGMSLVMAHTLFLRPLKAKPSSVLQIICGLSTAAAVSEHIYLDFKAKGGFHPEVLSIGYLLSSFLRGNILKGATTAWIMTFARHLIEPPAKILKLEARATDPACDEQQCEYEAKIVKELTVQGGAMGMLSHLPGLLLGMYTDKQLTTEDRIFREIQKISSEHNDVLEGLEQAQHGIRLQVGS
jgi:hypothetical protein